MSSLRDPPTPNIYQGRLINEAFWYDKAQSQLKVGL